MPTAALMSKLSNRRNSSGRPALAPLASVSNLPDATGGGGERKSNSPVAQPMLPATPSCKSLLPRAMPPEHENR